MAVSKSWSFTLNNYTEEEEALLKGLDVSYIVFGRELSTTGTPHLQGSVTFKKAMRLSALKKINERAHWEVTRCVPASERYCRKEGDFFEKKPPLRTHTKPPDGVTIVPFDCTKSTKEQILLILKRAHDDVRL